MFSLQPCHMSQQLLKCPALHGIFSTDIKKKNDEAFWQRIPGRNFHIDGAPNQQPWDPQEKSIFWILFLSSILARSGIDQWDGLFLVHHRPLISIAPFFDQFGWTFQRLLAMVNLEFLLFSFWKKICFWVI